MQVFTWTPGVDGYTIPADNSSKNKTIIKILGVDGSLHPSSRQFI